MSDIEILRSGELMVSHINGETDEGVEFIDGYNTPGAEFVVVDSGRIILPNNDVDAFVAACKQRGLSVGRADAAY